MVKNIVLRYDESSFEALQKLKRLSEAKSWESFVIDAAMAYGATLVATPDRKTSLPHVESTEKKLGGKRAPLTEGQKTEIKSHRAAGKSHREIARIMGISSAVVGKVLAMAR